MSRSFRKPYAYYGFHKDTGRGKQLTNRKLRRLKDLQCHKYLMGWTFIHEYDLDFFLNHLQDKLRGRAGSKNHWLWDYHSEGRYYEGVRKLTPRGHLEEIPDDPFAKRFLERHGMTEREYDQGRAIKLCRK